MEQFVVVAEEVRTWVERLHTAVTEKKKDNDVIVLVAAVEKQEVNDAAALVCYIRRGGGEWCFSTKG